MKKLNLNFENELKVAKEAAFKARAILLNHYGKLSNVSEKFQAGLVSEADKNSENAIKDHLMANFVDYKFLGEEEAFEGKSQVNSLDQCLWVVDPLDGTTNYIHRFPIFCISIALVINKEPVVGVIDVPILNDTYWATKGGGAFLNGQKIQVSQTSKLKSCLAATGFFAEKEELINSQLDYFSKILRKVRGVRRPGAAAYDLCMVASGVFDFFWEQNLSPWDVAAGQLLVEEAGGCNTTFTGSKYDPWQNTILSSNSIVHEDVVSIFKSQNADKT